LTLSKKHVGARADGNTVKRDPSLTSHLCQRKENLEEKVKDALAQKGSSGGGKGGGQVPGHYHETEKTK